MDEWTAESARICYQVESVGSSLKKDPAWLIAMSIKELTDAVKEQTEAMREIKALIAESA